ncbi:MULTISPECIES: sensor domain-containing diguanylate cyclase [Oceanibaculum]|uniref:diguanylate cyclase n=2 Tax=Oceanibaculum indicum TaxID=526216 RepID=K2KML3_9PROT|nr:MULTISPECIES: sensor domain-containing diguanylate cyclase [Oceanibaculum]EKE78725.1 diguanylate cyclase [Oceanibaculum indicum P24]MCH2395887.1 diguanylate cyclase [Oceanibaculum sp.]RKQ72592.1 diguanylate cyclase (GGDEF)-like protein [Oceanibaculum indicum]
MRPSHFLDRLSLPTQLGIAIGLLMAALVFLSTLAIDSYTTRRLQDRIGTDLAVRATIMQKALDNGMYERFRDVVNLSNMHFILNLEQASDRQLAALLDRMKKTYPLYSWIGIVKPDGTVRASTGDMLVGVNVSARDWFKGALNGPFVGDVHDAMLLAKLLGASDLEPLRFIDVAAPILTRDGKVAGVLGAHLSAEWLREVRNSTQSNDDLAEQRSFMILDQNGKVLVGGPFGQDYSELASFRQARAGKNGFVRETVNGHDSIIGYRATEGYKDYEGLGWVVLSFQPAERALAPVVRLQYVIILVGLLLASLATILGWLTARRLASPLNTLRATAEALGRDPHEANLPRLFGSSEMIALSQSLRALVRRLQRAEGAVEQMESQVESRVAEKTSELQAVNESLIELAERDALTGLLNRRGLEARGRHLMTRMRETGGELSVMLLDIDHFKAVNDLHGHPIGDKVLQAIAWQCLAVARGEDVICRLGGEEIAILSASPLGGALKLAERLRKRIESNPVSVESVLVSITVSIGVAAVNQSDPDMMAGIARADEALYMAKRSGRNRCVLYQDASAERRFAG